MWLRKLIYRLIEMYVSSGLSGPLQLKRGS
jgi:hypothetical protein